MACKRIRVNQAKCISCGACIATSPSKAINFDETNKAKVDPTIVTAEDDICVDVCPVEAIELVEFDETTKTYKK